MTQKLDERQKNTPAKRDHPELFRAQDGGLLGGFEALIAVPRAAPSGSRRRVF
jgi:hypothetical protein